ncbi:coiled-coil domain-containing protein [Robiginitalea biformata]|uniref:Tail tape measure protein n=1 Tax=Robiginitalea biformata (strain ATCC BAA-864 / DSM 15991 / KCTC 12146 / HTCC2501) TaxID=313596 RepID=A4CP55_ROBBH|nr:hypothetical protein [Robiginitalea biformata]EAR14672.1 hypothetical protein RB2501_01311 [Robiginitalea biformata HTCC2501]
MAEGQITGPELIADDVFARISKLDEALGKLILQLNNIEGAAKGAFNTGQLNEQSRQANQVNSQANEIIRERERLERALIRLQERNRQTTSQTNREIIKQRVEIQATTRNLKREETARNAIVGAYRQQSAQLNILKERYKDLAVEERQSTAEGRKLAREIEVLQRRVRGADQAVGDFQRNVGNYKSGIAGLLPTIRQLVGGLGLIEGIRIGFRFLRDAAAVERQARGVQFAFERLGDSGEQAFEKVQAATRGLVSNLEIKRSLVEFDNFNISLEESATLFEFLAVRAAQTGQNIDKLRDSLVEGLSKESKLRIDNLGISAQELNQELAQTPDFVQAVANIARRELGQAGGILDDAANGGDRFNAAMEDLTVTVGQLVNQIKGLDSTVGQIEASNFALQNLQTITASNVSTWQKFISVFNLASGQGQVNNFILAEEIRLRGQVEKEIQAQIKAYRRLKDEIGPAGQDEVLSGGGGSILFNNAASQTVADLREEIKGLQEDLDKVAVGDRASAQAIQDQIKAKEDELNATLGIVETEERRLKNLQGSIGFYQDFVSRQEQLRDATATTAEEFAAFNRQIEIGKAKILELQGAFEDSFIANPEKIQLSEVFDFFDQADDDQLPQIAADVDQFLNTEGIRQGMENLAELLKEDQDELNAQFEQGYEQDFQAFLRFSKAKIEIAQEEKEARLELAQDALSGISDLGSSLFEIAEQRAEREVELQNEAFDAIINSKNATEEQIEIAEKKRAENEKKRQQEREKRQKQEFLLQQAIEVARIFLADAQARANATASSYIFPLSLDPSYLPRAMAIISTQTGIALATVLAQSLPAFFTGKGLMDDYEGLATWGERGREVRVSKDGRVEVSPDTTTPTYVKKDDLILRNIPLFRQQMDNPNSEVFKRVAGAWKQDTAGRERVATVPGYNVRNLENSIDRGLRKGFRGVKHQINIINKIDPQPRVTRY